MYSMYHRKISMLSTIQLKKTTEKNKYTDSLGTLTVNVECKLSGKAITTYM